MKNSLCCFAFLLQGSLFAQDIPVGTWRTHFSYQSARVIATSKSHVFCATQNGLFVYDQQKETSTLLTKLNGLSDAGVRALAFVEQKEILLIGYQSGGIDLLGPEQVRTITTLRDLEEIPTKGIRDFAITGQQVFAATDIGLALLDLEQLEVRDVYNEIGANGQSVSASQVETTSETIYALTDHGILCAALSSNLLDFNNWSNLPGTDSMKINSLATVNELLFAIAEDTVLLEYKNEKWRQIASSEIRMHSLKVIEGKLHILGDHYLLTTDTDSTLTMLRPEHFVAARDVGMVEGDLFIADATDGLLRLGPNESTHILPNGPISDEMTRISLQNGKLFAVFGQIDIEAYTHFSGSYDVFENGRWLNTPTALSNLSDVVDFQSHRILSSFDSSLLLIGPGGPEARQFESHSVTDIHIADDELWIAIHDDHAPLRSTSDLAQWTSYSVSKVGTRFPVALTSTHGGIIWITRDTEEGGGITAFSPVEGLQRSITTTDGLPSLTVQDVSIDQQDEAWIGSSAGLVFFFDATFIFDNDPAIEPFFESGTFSGNESVTAIAFDGGNRRWVGTTEGLWLFTENLTDQLSFFDVTNSPMPSDHVKELAFDDSTGELFILTDQGLLSYQTDSKAPAAEHQNVRVFPNPYSLRTGQRVAISGLVSGGTVKITDVRGRIVRELRSYGSMTSWDLRDHRSEEISPGVYLFFSSNATGEETFIGKLAVVP